MEVEATTIGTLGFVLVARNSVNMIVLECSPITNLTEITIGEIRGYSSDALIQCKNLIVPTHQPCTEKKQRKIVHEVYCRYQNLCSNEEWKSFFHSLSTNTLKKRKYIYDDNSFTIRTTKLNVVFNHPPTIDIRALLLFQEHCRRHAIFSSEEDRRRIETQSRTTVQGPAKKKVNKNQMMLLYLNGPQFAQQCEDLGVDVERTRGIIQNKFQINKIKASDVKVKQGKIVRIENLDSYVHVS